MIGIDKIWFPETGCPGYGIGLLSHILWLGADDHMFPVRLVPYRSYSYPVFSCFSYSFELRVTLVTEAVTHAQ